LLELRLVVEYSISLPAFVWPTCHFWYFLHPGNNDAWLHNTYVSTEFYESDVAKLLTYWNM